MTVPASASGATAPQPSAPSLREIAAHTTITFLSTLAIQTTTFAILALAALTLPVTEFARLSLIVASVMLASALFEFGLNITATKMYGDTRDEGYLRAAFAMRLLMVLVGGVAGVGLALAGATDVGTGILLGALLNVWNGMRATDQARQDYSSFTRSSVAFAVLRAGAGMIALLMFADPLLIAIAIYGLPVVASVLSSSARLALRAFAWPWPPLRDALRYGGYVYVNAVTFIAIPYVPQFFIASRLDATAVGTYGLILTFVGPVSLLIYSLRSVLLPKMLGSPSAFESLLWSKRGLALIGAFWAVMMAGGVAVACGIGMAYGARFPQIETVFLIFFAGFSGTAAIGLYSLSVHTRGVPGLAAAIGLAKLIALIPAVILFGTSLVGIVSAVAAIMVGFEVVLALLLRGKARP
ncbi:hypothetical protein [Hyphomicrobium sulfonivorans]|uniref:hypothetical protein n=1 Tax=Hyphomicrobium sulfonivorans TaxID=121290 RepID=UPI00156FF6CA|nr:hypothetical protein [Hyphomicrobium sulfonivorans]MBI1649588.1 hypothetical protein [Hyphomicrobium sulfonivorans]NSL71504.1 hypothetical protein [Hyphomicrobium sulfonivorans]